MPWVNICKNVQKHSIGTVKAPCVSYIQSSHWPNESQLLNWKYDPTIYKLFFVTKKGQQNAFCNKVLFWIFSFSIHLWLMNGTCLCVSYLTPKSTFLSVEYKMKLHRLLPLIKHNIHKSWAVHFPLPSFELKWCFKSRLGRHSTTPHGLQLQPKLFHGDSVHF